MNGMSVWIPAGFLRGSHQDPHIQEQHSVDQCYPRAAFFPGCVPGMWGRISSFWGLDIYIPENRPLPLPLKYFSAFPNESLAVVLASLLPRSSRTGVSKQGESLLLQAPVPSVHGGESSAFDLPPRHVIVQNQKAVRRERIEKTLRFPKDTSS